MKKRIAKIMIVMFFAGSVLANCTPSTPDLIRDSENVPMGWVKNIQTLQGNCQELHEEYQTRGGWADCTQIAQMENCPRGSSCIVIVEVMRPKTWPELREGWIQDIIDRNLVQRCPNDHRIRGLMGLD